MRPLSDRSYRLRILARELRQLLEVQGIQAALPAALESGLRSIEERTERPEVRVLILGPLKAGKSTLMNVLLKNPYVSQISQLPAYPCFVEVRDIERDGDGRPVARERSLFFPVNGEPPEEYELEEGRLKLDRLLDDYISGGDPGRIEYRKVEQRVDLAASAGDSSMEGLDLILLDSPGLFFDRRIDQQVFQFEASTGRRSTSPDTTLTELYGQSDLVIFTLRWDQLFFHMFAEYLRQFRADLSNFHSVRTFILVNASSRSLTQNGSQIKEFDQVAEENQQKLRLYFERHVGDPDLVAELRAGNRISLHFCDLLEVAQDLFGSGLSLRPARSRRLSVEVIRQIREEIFDRGLPRRKVEDLTHLWLDVGRHAISHLERLSTQQRDRLASYEDHAIGLTTRIGAFYEEVSRQESQLSRVASEVEAYAERARRVARNDFRRQRLDAVTAAYLLLLRQLEQAPLEEVPSAMERKELLRAGYRVWRETEQPRLADLPNWLWNFRRSPEERSPAMSYEAACARGLAIFEQQTRDLLDDEELLAVTDRFGADDIPWPPDPPARILSGTLPLLEFEPRRGAPWTQARLWPLNLTAGFGPADLWGPQGQRVITAPNERRLLVTEEDLFLEQIWGEPWNLGSSLTQEHLKPVLLEAFRIGFSGAWLDVIGERQAQKQELAQQLRHQLDLAAAELGNLRSELDALEHDVQERCNLLDDLAVRQQKVSDLPSDILTGA